MLLLYCFDYVDRFSNKLCFKDSLESDTSCICTFYVHHLKHLEMEFAHVALKLLLTVWKKNLYMRILMTNQNTCASTSSWYTCIYKLCNEIWREKNGNCKDIVLHLAKLSEKVSMKHQVKREYIAIVKYNLHITCQKYTFWWLHSFYISKIYCWL